MQQRRHNLFRVAMHMTLLLEPHLRQKKAVDHAEINTLTGVVLAAESQLSPR